jgi:hypothetical protein
MANAHYKRELESRIRNVAERARQTAVGHRGVTGELRELLAVELLQAVLPPWIQVATRAVIIDHKGGESGEVDIVIYDGTSLPPLSFAGTPKLIPVDACLYAIEVKTKLTAARVREALEGAEKIARLDYVPELLERSVPKSHVFTALFALDTDLVGRDDINRITQVRSEERYWRIAWGGDRWWRYPTPALNVVCVVGGQYAWGSIELGAPTTTLRDYQWRLWPASGDPLDEVVGFVTGIANTAPQMARARPPLDLGYYLIDQ